MGTTGEPLPWEVQEWRGPSDILTPLGATGSGPGLGVGLGLAVGMWRKACIIQEVFTGKVSVLAASDADNQWLNSRSEVQPHTGPQEENPSWGKSSTKGWVTMHTKHMSSRHWQDYPNPKPHL